MDQNSLSKLTKRSDKERSRSVGNGRLWIGCDPGGQGAFGIALVSDRAIVDTRVCGYVDEAVAVASTWMQEHKGMIAGMGVDAPLWWSSGRSGDRRADQRIRYAYGLSGGRVQAVNSLRGAAIAQGLLIVSRMRQEISQLPVTECHPKVLLEVLDKQPRQRLLENVNKLSEIDGVSEHARDAVVASIAAREGFSKNWPTDLAEDRLPSEQNPKSHWIGPVHYFWPEPI